MKCRFEHDDDCCNSGSPQYMCKCKPDICHSSVPMTNADRIRAMSDEEWGDTVYIEDICIQLAQIYDILGEDYDIERLRKLVEEDRAGRCKTLEKIVLEYQETIVPGYRKLAEKAMEERDAAVSDIETVMAYGGANVDTCQFCKNGQCYARGGTKLCLPKWRGKKE